MAPTLGLLLPFTKIEEGNGHHPTPIVGPAISSPEASARRRPGRRVQGPGRSRRRPRPWRYDRDRLTDRLLGLVSQRTGYPKDMLGLDVDLEADLGIDSIKRIEILSEVTTDLGTDAQSMATGLEMEKLTVIRTLRGIIDYLDDALSSPPDPDPSGAVASTSDIRPKGPTGPLRSGARFCRFSAPLWTWSIAPSSHLPDSMLTEGVVLFTDDGRGIARLMADQLADLGQRTVFLGSSEDPASGPDQRRFPRPT